MAAKPVKQKVMRVAQSPMNAQRWCCTLECGYEMWVTAKKGPRKPKMNCDRCSYDARNKVT